MLLSRTSAKRDRPDFFVIRVRHWLYVYVPVGLVIRNVVSDMSDYRLVLLLRLAILLGVIHGDRDALNTKDGT